MSANPFTNALTRTTTAVTMFNAGVKSNVISPYAEAIVNFRIHPAQTIEQVRYTLECDITLRLFYKLLKHWSGVVQV